MRKEYSTRKSEELYKSAASYLVDGVSSPSRGSSFYSPTPVFMVKGTGPYIWDADGNKYIDYVMGYGSIVHGHADRRIVETIYGKASEGTHFAIATPEELELAKRIESLFPSIEKIRFVSTGTEAAMMAVRLARAFSTRKKILKFEGHYHGWYDHLLYNTDPQVSSTLGAERDPVHISVGSGLPEDVGQNLVTVWNNVEELRRRVKISKNEICCIITEPVMANLGVILPEPGYLKEVQEIANDNDIPFILDETVTGFRTFPGGAQLDFNVKPDITIFGKALGAGLPIAAYGGRDDIMEILEWGKVLSYGTQNAHRLSVSVALKSLELLFENERNELFKIKKLCDRLATQISDFSGKVLVQKYGSILQLYFLGAKCPKIKDLRDYVKFVDTTKYNVFANSLRRNGVFVPHSQGLHLAISTAHNEKVVDETAELINETIKDMP